MTTGKPRLFGADYSVYVRIARLALLEKNIDHELVPVDIFSANGVPDWYLDRHPFKRIPAFEHGTVRLFETAAITRYVDEAFSGPVLQPADPVQRAKMNQAIGLLDAYAYRALVWGVYVERVSKAERGEACDDRLVAASLKTADTCLSALSDMMQDGPWIAGDRLTLADLHAAPMLAYFTRAPEGAAMVHQHRGIAEWWDAMRSRTSFRRSEPKA